MRKILIQWAGVGILALIGWGVDLMPAITSWVPSVALWSIAGVWFLLTLLHWPKNSSLSNIRRKKSQWRNRLKRLMETIEYEYARLADKAINYPLNSYEEHYLLPIDIYKQAKIENDTSHSISKNQLIMNGLMHYYRHFNPRLEKLIEDDIKTNPKSVFKELKTVREQVDSDNISDGIRCMQVTCPPKTSPVSC